MIRKRLLGELQKRHKRRVLTADGMPGTPRKPLACVLPARREASPPGSSTSGQSALLAVAARNSPVSHWKSPGQTAASASAGAPHRRAMSAAIRKEKKEKRCALPAGRRSRSAAGRGKQAGATAPLRNPRAPGRERFLRRPRRASKYRPTSAQLRRVSPSAPLVQQARSASAPAVAHEARRLAPRSPCSRRCRRTRPECGTARWPRGAGMRRPAAALRPARPAAWPRTAPPWRTCRPASSPTPASPALPVADPPRSSGGALGRGRPFAAKRVGWRETQFSCASAGEGLKFASLRARAERGRERADTPTLGGLRHSHAGQGMLPLRSGWACRKWPWRPP